MWAQSLGTLQAAVLLEWSESCSCVTGTNNAVSERTSCQCLSCLHIPANLGS
jgi:hypothetical protein